MSEEIEKILPPVIVGVISAIAALFYWQFYLAPAGWSPFPLLCLFLIAVVAILGAVTGAIIGFISSALLEMNGITENKIKLISSVLTASFIGVVAINLY